MLKKEHGELIIQDAYEQPQPLRLFPEKLFYKIGEVSRVVGVESYVLRYWETEFPFLNPRKSKSGQRIYAKNDVDLLKKIKYLLYEEKYTIDGVRRKIGSDTEQLDKEVCLEDAEADTGSSASAEKILTMVKSRLKEILNDHFVA